jgi:quaternary ammonium compound-resistance protein SugE
MAWVLLFIAGAFETAWAIALKEAEGFTKAGATLAFVAALVASMVLLALALRDLPLGTGYAVWTGTGAVGAALAGVAILGEPATIGRLPYRPHSHRHRMACSRRVEEGSPPSATPFVQGPRSRPPEHQGAEDPVLEAWRRNEVPLEDYPTAGCPVSQPCRAPGPPSRHRVQPARLEVLDEKAKGTGEPQPRRTRKDISMSRTRSMTPPTR